LFSLAEQERVRSELLRWAEEDAAVTAAATTGSAALGTADRWSDVDLFLGVEGPLATAVDRWTGRLTAELGAVHHWDLPSGRAVYRVFLLPGWLEVDLGFTPADAFAARGPSWRRVFGSERPPEPPAATDRDQLVGLAWHHVRHAHVSIERGRWWQAEHWVAAARAAVLHLAGLRHGHDTDHARAAHLVPADELAGLDGTLVRDLTAGELHRALTATATALGAELTRWDDDADRGVVDLLAGLPSR
jgi:hypothetical protein